MRVADSNLEFNSGWVSRWCNRLWSQCGPSHSVMLWPSVLAVSSGLKAVRCLSNISAVNISNCVRTNVTYIQGQSPEPRIREYFYYIDHQGQVTEFVSVSQMHHWHYLIQTHLLCLKTLVMFFAYSCSLMTRKWRILSLASKVKLRPHTQITHIK